MHFFTKQVGVYDEESISYFTPRSIYERIGQ
jgi:hypothetical protein